MSATARAIVDDVLGRAMTREIWSGNYEKVLPVSVQSFDLTAVLPSVFYMFRFGHRRGRGKFIATFGGDTGTIKERRRAATIERVSEILAEVEDAFKGFDSETGQAILGDLLLCFCLENTKRALGRKEQIQRCAPAHYMASWVDLPEQVAHLRYVPETIVAMLANQQTHYVEQNQDSGKSWFAVGRGFEDNVLLSAFNKGVVRSEEPGEFSSRTSDRFDEEIPVGLDQLLMVRLAQQLGEAPGKIRARGSDGDSDSISNQRPIAEQATEHFSEDIRRFVKSYAAVIPRHAFVELLESCVAVGLTTIVTSVMELLFEWVDTGQIRRKRNQQPTNLFVDCSNGVNRQLRALAEQSMDDFMRRIQRFPAILMSLRLLDHGVRYDRRLKKLDVQTRPYATDWLNLLGEVLHERHADAGPILDGLDSKAEELAEKLASEYPEAADVLKNELVQPNPVWRIAEALTSLQQHLFLTEMIDSVLLVSRPNGLATKRTVTRKTSLGGGAKRREVRSIVFTDSVLDYLVHLHVLRTGSKGGTRRLSFACFVQILRERHGFCVDVAPPGLTTSNDLLQLNRAVLERRLRDLGLLVGVNDAESMKHLQPRFERPAENDDGMA